MKRLTKLIISFGFFLCTSVGNTIRRFMRVKPRATCVVLAYHGVAPKDRAQFARQMDALICYTRPITADHRHPLRPGEHCAAVTFDDGFLSVVENAVPELMLRKIPATLFIVTDFLGSTAKWTTFDRDDVAQERTVSAGQLKDLPADLITIGSHTLSHPWLPSLPEAQAKNELSTSRDKLRSLLKRDITLFSFPYGALNERLVHWSRDAGYQRVFTTLPMLAFADPQEFVTGRVRVEPADWPVEFRLKLLGAYQWLPWAFAWKRKMFSRPSLRSAGSEA